MSFRFLFAKNAVQRMCGVCRMWERVGVVVASKLFQRRIPDSRKMKMEEKSEKKLPSFFFAIGIRARMCARSQKLN